MKKSLSFICLLAVITIAASCRTSKYGCYDFSEKENAQRCEHRNA